jgi:hypothetical protein
MVRKERIKMDKIELIFNMYKDSVVVSKKFKLEMIKKFRLSDEQIRNLFIRIHNYQVNVLGARLTLQERAYSAQEKYIANWQANQRKYENKTRRYKFASNLSK